MDVCVLASALRAAPAGLHPFPPLRRPVSFIFSAAWPVRDFHLQASFQRSGLQRNSFRLLRRLLTSPPRSRALRPAQSGVPDTTEISRGKIDRLACTPAGFTTPALDDRGLCDQLLARPAGWASLSGFVHRAAGLLHASFRPHLAMTPLRFTNPSPPSGWVQGLPPPSLSIMLGTQQKARSMTGLL